MSLTIFQQRILPIKDKLYRLAFRLLQNVQEAEDVVQDSMIRIWNKRKEWDQWQSIEAYCMIAVRNSCLDRLRKQRLRPVGEESAWNIGSKEKDPEEKMMDKETMIQIRRCMSALPQNQQLVVHLREVEGLSYNEIAEILDMSMDQVKVNLFRGRNAIRQSITKQKTV